MRMTLLLSFFLVSGCAPFVEYEHLSRPNVNDSGHDLFCIGMASTETRVDVSAGLCEDLRTPVNAWHEKGTFVKANVRYTFNVE